MGHPSTSKCFVLSHPGTCPSRYMALSENVLYPSVRMNPLIISDYHHHLIFKKNHRLHPDLGPLAQLLVGSAPHMSRWTPYTPDTFGAGKLRKFRGKMATFPCCHYHFPTCNYELVQPGG